MDIRQLKYFTAVVDEGTISAAARSLHISQPPLSSQIRLLETEYGVKLFERGARGITLTEAGSTLYRHAKEILEMEKVTNDDMRELTTGRKGSIRIGVVSSGSSGEFFRGIKSFRRSNPDVNFIIYEANTYQLLEQLDAGKIELAVVRTPYRYKAAEQIVLRRDSVVAVGVKDLLPGFPDRPIRLADLGGLPLIMYRRWESIIREKCDAEGFSPHVICLNDDARTSLAWAKAGMGIALVPTSILSDTGDLSIVPLDEPELQTAICLLRKKGAPLSGSAAALLKMWKNL